VTEPGPGTPLRLPGHGRYLQSPTKRRPAYAWPNGARIIANPDLPHPEEA
jgi:hypothetical protein